MGRIFIKDYNTNKIIGIDLDDILYFEADTDDSKIRLRSDPTGKNDYRLRGLYKLNVDGLPHYIKRVCRKYIINLSQIKVIEDGYVYFENDIFIPVGVENVKNNIIPYIDYIHQ
jgi:DNA-binding LytR/AlgR family response regulator